MPSPYVVGPTAVRGVFYSIAAAVGKIFAFIASYVYERKYGWQRNIFGYL